PRARRGGALARTKARVNGRQLLPGEAGPGAAGVDQLPALLVGEVQRAESGARALRPRVPDDREVRRSLEAHLDPVRRAALAVGGVRLLSDDALQPEPARGPQEVLASLLEVVGV